MKGISNTGKWFATMALITGLSVGNVAQAATYDGALGDDGAIFGFSGFSWTADFSYAPPSPPGTGNGQILVNEATPGPLQIVGSADGTGNIANTFMTTTVSGNGTIDFVWDFLQTGADFFLAVNGVVETVIDTGSSTLHPNCIYGVLSCSIALNDGDTFGLGIKTFTNGAAGAVLNFTSFTTSGFGGNPSPVPVPPAFLLFGSALAGLGFMRKKKQTTA